MKPAGAFNTMAELRAEIDSLDSELVALLGRRAQLIGRAAVLKQVEGLPARIEDRVSEVLSRVQECVGREGLDPELVATIWRILIEWSIAKEEKEMEAS